jgi:hypothetical protein
MGQMMREARRSVLKGRRTWIGGLSALGVVLALACGGATITDQKPCAPGESIACVSQAGCSGAQTCMADGSGYNACLCFGTGGANSGDAGGHDAAPGSPSEGSTSDAVTSDTADASQDDYCSGALILSLGGSVQGTTCGGVSGHSAPCGSNLVVYLYVDAPDGAEFELSASPGVQLLGYSTCQSELPESCTINPTFGPTEPTMRLFGVERFDTNCGQFTVSVSGSSPPSASSDSGTAVDASTSDAAVPDSGDGGPPCPVGPFAPDIGSSCSQSGQTCTYGVCGVAIVKCFNGTWQKANGDCPP